MAGTQSNLWSVSCALGWLEPRKSHNHLVADRDRIQTYDGI